ncbi:N-acetylglucosamine kinase [Adhaeribacter sp. BT258]|uniref:N-acetylglucosamine kinase n=1 Tax=Adhaeribacter terrigena TaxID=2793070 RepID=A0ABS1C4V7_9BACT|nr:BadF/BadG/BcrA/BcrD ATPase family protein [Adhaeribacter terrigena]MBK0404428.1 N-acetylglucosamine kinase [Adhaeribacter terrigena]
MILIADSGATKTDWCLLDKKGTETSIKTQGISPHYQTSEEIAATVKAELLPQLGEVIPAEIFFYGTGCSSDKSKAIVTKGLREAFPETEIAVDHDLIAAARALCGREEGIACILGTGSNSCHFKDGKIAYNVPNLGFILGDEGSGGYLGKRLIQAFLNLELPGQLHEKFKGAYNLSHEEIIHTVYTKPFPNRYLATFAKFLGENREDPFLAKLIHTGINDFFLKNITRYQDHQKLPVHFLGSIAYHFNAELKAIAASHNVSIGRIIKTPMEGLIAYHT